MQWKPQTFQIMKVLSEDKTRRQVKLLVKAAETLSVNEGARLGKVENYANLGYLEAFKLIISVFNSELH